MRNFGIFFNAIHYCIWLIYTEFSDFVGRIVEMLLAPIPKYLFTKNYKKKYYGRLLRQQKKMKTFYCNRENGFNISWAHHLYGYFCSGYSAFLSFVLVGIVDKKVENLNPYFLVLLFSIPILVCYIPIYQVVFANKRYLRYFKSFEKKDSSWHKKWKWITLLFCIGSVGSSVLGIYMTSLIVHLLYCR